MSPGRGVVAVGGKKSAQDPTMSKKIKLTRRSALAGLGTIGLAAAGAGLGTSAFLNDQETIKQNTFQAGTLNLQLDWCWYYDGAKMEYGHQDAADNIVKKGPMFKLEDVKPGDHGCGVISVHVTDNPAYVWLRANNFRNEENGYAINEPRNSGDGDVNSPGDANGMGELANNINLVAAPLCCVTPGTKTSEELAKKHSTETVDLANYSTTANKSDMVESDTAVAPYYAYSLGTLDQAMTGVLGNGVNLGPHTKDSTCFYGFCWCIPTEASNEIETDTVSFDLEFFAEQTRHNPNPQNPFSN